MIIIFFNYNKFNFTHWLNNEKATKTEKKINTLINVTSLYFDAKSLL